MHILLLNPNLIYRHNWGHQLFKNEFGKHHDVVYYGERFPNFDPNLSVPQILEKIGKPFDLILTYEIKWSRFFKGLDEITDIPKAHIQVDYAKATKQWSGFARHENTDKYLKYNKPDLIFVVNNRNVEDMKRNLNIDRVFLLPFSVDVNLYKDLHLKRDIDVMATFSSQPKIYPDRVSVLKVLSSMKIKKFTGRVIHEEYIKKINQSKIFAHAGNFNKRLNMKYFEVLACNTLFLTDRPHDFQELGFVDGKHLVLYSGMTDLKNKIKYFLTHEEERRKIAEQGMEFVRKNHSCAVRVQEFTEIVKRELDI